MFLHLQTKMKNQNVGWIFQLLPTYICMYYVWNWSLIWKKFIHIHFFIYRIRMPWIIFKSSPAGPLFQPWKYLVIKVEIINIHKYNWNWPKRVCFFKIRLFIPTSTGKMEGVKFWEKSGLINFLSSLTTITDSLKLGIVFNNCL